MMDDSLFPKSVCWCYVRTDPEILDLSNFYNLHPLEQSLVSQATDQRKAEFGDARWCAHRALEDLGKEHGDPILRGHRGMPLWPDTVCGSITHTGGFRAAAVAPQLFVRSLGIDVEPAEPLPDGVLSGIARAGEYRQLDSLRKQGIACADRLLFCAKEATYKTWFPLTHRWLGFEQAEIDLREDGTFISYLLVRPTPVPFINGRWSISEGYILATAFIH
ncbi:4'-phosphopantetheinyl transferase superfamily protein [Corynebacterium poyangense]|uniref:4'-phosphopantetheinyl transferase superfamily protein n=1 Tax=Corynebacterium poyangense TaxID=2684405 RepID=A0A7H0SPG0_9CORY|nr:4'-phosphopantetheinyl transferase superfamily protein [Corynebacterium poyangense]MBZ8178015.1 4'-phosphopantetheinyl transferase superfamily protein [Corynebacterium poyangense]QNQ90435.1 4'-phosphopantetheinyl transferase superfamily protein [Corynebacterium poyangense]